MTPEVRKQIEEGVKEIAKKSTAPDKETPDWMETDIRRGAEFGYQLACKSSHPEQGEQGEDPFIQKHLAIIMDKMLDGMIITHIEKMFGSLEMASVEHFIETGKVNGSLYLNIKELAKKFAAGWHNQAAKLSSPPTEGQDEYWGQVGSIIIDGQGQPNETIEMLKQSYLLIKK